MESGGKKKHARGQDTCKDTSVRTSVPAPQRGRQAQERQLSHVNTPDNSEQVWKCTRAHAPMCQEPKRSPGLVITCKRARKGMHKHERSHVCRHQGERGFIQELGEGSKRE